MTSVLWLVVLAAAGYFLLIRPTRRRAHEVRALQNALGVGADVILTSGIFGTVTAIADEKVGVEIADGVVVNVHRGAIGKILTPPAPSEAASDVDFDAVEHPDVSATDESGTDADQHPRGAN